MHENLYETSGRNRDLPSNYIYYSVCDSLVFIPKNGLNAGLY